jgi:dethiobiotin synthetase
MKYKSIYVAATGQHVGKTTSTLGLTSVLTRRGIDVGYCKPVGQKFVELGNLRVDKDTLLFADLLDFTIVPELHSPILLGPGSTQEFLDDPAQFHPDQILIEAKEKLEERHDLVVFEGTGHPGVGSIANISNAQVAKKLGADVIIVVEGGIGSTIDMLNLCLSLFRELDVPILGVIVNKVKVGKMDKVKQYVGKYLESQNLPLLGMLPYDKNLAYPVMKTVAGAIQGTVTHNAEMLGNKVADIVAGSLLDLEDLKGNQDLLLVVATRLVDEAIEKIKKYSLDHGIEGSPLAGIVATGTGELDPHCLDYIEKHKIPTIRTHLDTYGSVIKISRIEVKINRSTPWKIERAIKLIEDNVDLSMILNEV